MFLLYHIPLRSISLSTRFYRPSPHFFRSLPQLQLQPSTTTSRTVSTATKPRTHPADSSTKQQRSPSTKKKKNHPSRKKKQSARSRWKGLDVKRLPALPERILFQQQQHAIQHAFQSAIDAPHLHIPSLYTLLHTTRAHCGRPDLNPSDNLFASLIDRIVRHVAQEPVITILGAGGADIACEAFFQCIQLFQVRPDVPMLLAVLDGAARDPIVERRADRALSVFRFLRTAQLTPTPRFVFECFRVCVSGLAMESAAVLLDFALHHKFYRGGGGESGEGGEFVPTVRDYYNGMMYAALLTGDLNTTLTAHGEMIKNGIEPDELTQSIMVAVCLKRGDESGALSLFKSMQRRKCTIASCAYAALICAAGQRRDVDGVLQLVREYVEQKKCGSGVMFEGPVGLNSSRYELEVSSRAAALGAGDPLFSAFVALRACSAGKEAFELLSRLKDRAGLKPSRQILMFAMETCQREGRLDLARRLRLEMERDACLRVSQMLSEVAA